jgi:hypothetical protein
VPTALEADDRHNGFLAPRLIWLSNYSTESDAIWPMEAMSGMLRDFWPRSEKAWMMVENGAPANESRARPSADVEAVRAGL